MMNHTNKINHTIGAEGLRLIAEGLNRLADAFATPTEIEQSQNIQAIPYQSQVTNTPVYPGVVQTPAPIATSQPLPVQPTVPTQAAVIPMATQQVPVVPTTAVAQEYTQDQLAVACAGLVNQGKQPRLMQILQGFGVAALVDLPKERYGELATALRAEGAVI